MTWLVCFFAGDPAQGGWVEPLPGRALAGVGVGVSAGSRLLLTVWERCCPCQDSRRVSRCRDWKADY